MRFRLRRVVLVTSVVALTMALLPAPAGAKPTEGFLTGDAPFISLSVPGKVKAIISSGDEIGDFLFEGIPDGIGIRPGPTKHTVEVYVVHENTTVPFFGSRDFEDASISKLIISTKGGPTQGAILHAEVALPSSEGLLRFCSASMATPAEGFDTHVFFTGEETNDIVDEVQHGFAVALNTETGAFTTVPGMGRLNHENTVAIPGYDGIVTLTTDDTFSAPSSQLYMYIAEDRMRSSTTRVRCTRCA